MPTDSPKTLTRDGLLAEPVAVLGAEAGRAVRDVAGVVAHDELEVHALLAAGREPRVAAALRALALRALAAASRRLAAGEALVQLAREGLVVALREHALGVELREHAVLGLLLALFRLAVGHRAQLAQHARAAHRQRENARPQVLVDEHFGHERDAFVALRELRLEPIDGRGRPRLELPDHSHEPRRGLVDLPLLVRRVRHLEFVQVVPDAARAFLERVARLVPGICCGGDENGLASGVGFARHRVWARRGGVAVAPPGKKHEIAAQAGDQQRDHERLEVIGSRNRVRLRADYVQQKDDRDGDQHGRLEVAGIITIKRIIAFAAG